MTEPAQRAQPTFADLARMDRQTVTFTLNAEEFTVAPSSTELLDALTKGDPLAVVPGLCGRSQSWLWFQVQDRGSGVTPALLRRIALEVTVSLIGVPWWVGWRLASYLQLQWFELGGALAVAGIDVLSAPVHRSLSAVYALLLKEASAESAAKVDDQLWSVPEGLDVADVEAGAPRWVRTVSGGRKLVVSPERAAAQWDVFASQLGVSLDDQGFIDG